jgi:hypothetical protein
MELKIAKMIKYLLPKTPRAIKVIQQLFHKSKVQCPIMQRLSRSQRARMNAKWTRRSLDIASLEFKRWRMPNMNDHPLNLTGTLDPELELLLLLSLLSI